MPSYPNPYGPATQIGSGLQNISNMIFSMGRADMMGRYAQKQTEEQAAERLANAKEREARMNLLNQQTVEQQQQNATRTPEALAQYGAASANLPAHIYNGIVGMPAQHFDLDQGPSPALRYSDEQLNAARIGQQLAAHFAANNAPNPEQFAKAAGLSQINNDRNRVIEGQLGADIFGDSVAASAGKPRYGMSNGVQYSNQVAGNASMTPLGDAMVGTQKSIVGKNNAQAKQADAAANLSNTRANAGGFAPRSSGSGGTGGKRVSLTKAEVATMENQLADLAGTEFKKIDPQTRAAFISRASALAVDPESEFHRNPAGAMQAAVDEMAPGGFEDSTGPFSSAKFVPKGGGVPQQRQAAPNQAGSGGLPPQARAALKEGVHTTFKNGQTWSLVNGIPVQVQ